jgi:hypothetical protein
MAITFQTLLTDCLVALGDSSGTTWSRTTKMWPWCIEAMLSFPILRPMKDDHTNGPSTVYSFAMPTDFREVISVEYPVSQTPPTYLVRKNRLDPNFYKIAGFYDIDHDYASGSGWMMYVSGGVRAAAHVYTQYLANHNTDMADDGLHFISIPDEYENILIQNVICRAYRERLSYVMQDPTAHSSVIQQMTEMVNKAEEQYREMVLRAQEKLATSIASPKMTADKFDRVY